MKITVAKKQIKVTGNDLNVVITTGDVVGGYIVGQISNFAVTMLSATDGQKQVCSLLRFQKEFLTERALDEMLSSREDRAARKAEITGALDALFDDDSDETLDIWALMGVDQPDVKAVACG